MGRLISILLAMLIMLPLTAQAKRNFTTSSEYLNLFASSGNKMKLAVSTVTQQEVLANWFIHGKDMSANVALRTYKNMKEIYTYTPKEKALAAFNYGLSDFQSGKYFDALKKFKTALQIDPEFYKVYLFIGDCFFMRGHYKEAIKNFQILLSKNPIDYLASLYIADSYWKLGELSEAKNYLIRSLILNVRNGETWGKLRGLGELMGFEVDNNRFIPLVMFDDKANTIKIADNIWKNYGICKGVWKGDTSFFKRKTEIPNYKHTIAEELECVVNLLEGITLEKKSKQIVEIPVGIKRLQKIAAAGDLYGLVVMELFLPQNPLMSALISEHEMEELTSYIDKYILIRPTHKETSFGTEIRQALSSL